MAGHAAELTTQDILNALKGVQDPDLHRDLVDLGMIKDIQVQPGSVALTVNLTTPACPLKAKIENDVRTALTSRLGSGLRYDIKMTADVRGKGVREKGDIPGVKNVIAVGSGKGGVGKSTIAASLAFGLGSFGAKVGLLDADIYGPSIPHLVGSSSRPMARGDRLIPVQAANLKLMSMGFLIEPERAVVMRGPMLHGILQQFLHQVEWGELDYLIIDLPPGTGDVPLTLSQTLPLTGAVVVCTPQEVALLDATRAISMFRQLKVPILGVVENMSFFDIAAYLAENATPAARQLAESGGLFSDRREERVYLFGNGGARRRAEAMDVPFLGEVPLNILLRESGDAGRLGHVFQSENASRPYLTQLVENLASQISIQNMKNPRMPKLEILQ